MLGVECFRWVCWDEIGVLEVKVRVLGTVVLGWEC